MPGIRRRNIIARVSILLLLLASGGAIVNVAVAWGFAICVRAPNNNGNPLSSGFVLEEGCEKLAQPFEGSGWDITHKLARRLHKPGIDLIVVSIVGSPPRPTHMFEELLPPTLSTSEVNQRESDTRDSVNGFGYYLWDGRGWPFISMSSSWPWFRSSQWPNVAVNAGIPYDQPSRATGVWPYNIYALRAIPLRPVWPGFAINTIFYAAIVWLLVAAPGFLRRRLRIKRGQCPACAYPVGSSDVCTECGAPVNSRAAARTPSPSGRGPG